MTRPTRAIGPESPRGLTAWTAVLDEIDAGLSASPPVFLDPLPTDLGPVPPALVERATATLARMADLEATLEREQAEVARELTALAPAKAAVNAGGGSPVPHFLDTKA